MLILKTLQYNCQPDLCSKIISHTFIKTVLLIRTVFLFLQSSMAISKNQCQWQFQNSISIKTNFRLIELVLIIWVKNLDFSK
jgi:hypothetical protein